MAKRLWNYRSGDIKEDLGLMLLAGLGAVAPVPREDDFGVDAVVTLLESESKFLFPRQSFWVQLKSSDTSEIQLEDDEVEWLRLIDLPLFIGLVNGHEAAISLYSTNLVYEHFTIDAKYRLISLRFGTGLVEDASPTSLTVYLGEPILKWSVPSVFDRTFRQLGYQIMSKWLDIEGENVRSRKAGIYCLAAWKTNAPPAIGIKGLAIESVPPDEFHQTLRYIEPLMARLMAQMASHGGLAVEFPEYMLRIYSENGVECDRLRYLVNEFLPRMASRQKADPLK